MRESGTGALHLALPPAIPDTRDCRASTTARKDRRGPYPAGSPRPPFVPGEEGGRRLPDLLVGYLAHRHPLSSAQRPTTRHTLPHLRSPSALGLTSYRLLSMPVTLAYYYFNYHLNALTVEYG